MRFERVAQNQRQMAFVVALALGHCVGIVALDSQDLDYAPERWDNLNMAVALGIGFDFGDRDNRHRVDMVRNLNSEVAAYQSPTTIKKIQF